MKILELGGRKTKNNKNYLENQISASVLKKIENILKEMEHGKNADNHGNVIEMIKYANM